MATEERAWQDEAACRGLSPSLFVFGEYEATADKLARARSICATCPVIAECLTAAITHDEIGVWAGTTKAQRDRMRPRRFHVSHADHGTEAAYRNHLRHGESACSSCLNGHAGYTDDRLKARGFSNHAGVAS